MEDAEFEAFDKEIKSAIGAVLSQIDEISFLKSVIEAIIKVNGEPKSREIAQGAADKIAQNMSNYDNAHIREVFDKARRISNTNEHQISQQEHRLSQQEREITENKHMLAENKRRLARLERVVGLQDIFRVH